MEKINVLKMVIDEKDGDAEYADENIFSNVYLTSLSTSLRSLDGIREDQVKDKEEQNKWLLDDDNTAERVYCLNFDVIARMTGIEGVTSCDAFFYRFKRDDNQLHILCEFKNVSRSKMVEYLKSQDKDGIAQKLRSSIQMIRNNLIFSGSDESDEIVKNMHFIAVYNKKDMATSNGPIVPGLSKVTMKNGRQTRASRQSYKGNDKRSDLFINFEKTVTQLGLHSMNEDEFILHMEPDAKKDASLGKGKYRKFTLCSGSDFRQLMSNGYFDDWDYGDYIC